PTFGAVSFYYHANTGARTLIIRDSTIENNPVPGIEARTFSVGGTVPVAGTVKVLNNTVRGNEGGLAVTDETSGFSYRAAGNVLSGNNGPGVYLSRGDAGTIVEDNVIVNNVGGVAMESGNPIFRRNLIQSNRLFIGSFSAFSIFGSGNPQVTFNTFVGN